MNPIGRPGLTPTQKKDLWRRWRDGQSLSEIARALGKHPGSIHGVVKANGGIVPEAKTRAARSLTSAEREEISRGLAQGESIRAIAARLQRAPSTISREVDRHGGRTKYRAARADARAWNNAQRPKLCRLSTNVELCEAVADKLADDWSPQQISGWLRSAYVDDATMRVSPETIYRSLFLQTRGVLDKKLVTHLRRVRSMRSSRNASTEGQGRGGIVDAVSISDRPAEVAGSSTATGRAT
jgi:IS30 family transposase